MSYCKYVETGNIPRYAEVELREGVLHTVAPMVPPEEDYAARLAAPALIPFHPTPVSELRLLPPVTPSKILGVGRNYRDHAAEMGNPLPKSPLLFLKPPSSLIPSGATIRLPRISSRVDFEGELAIVIGRRCRNLTPNDDLRSVIRGYTLVNDVTARDFQKTDGHWIRGKGFDTFCPVGPIVSTEIDPLTTPITLTTRQNGEIRQHGSTADLIFPIPLLLQYITSFTTLEPGDIIPTGTPAGVGPLQPGDSIQIEVEGLGVLVNGVASEEPTAQSSAP